MLLYTLVLVALFSTTTTVVIDVPGSTVDNATSPGSLQYYLCANGSTAITHHSILHLSSSSPHTLLPGHFCLVAHLSNVTITSDGSNNTAHIVCHNVTGPTTGLGFMDMTHLTLHNLHFSHCGGIISSESLSSINESRIYFPPGQTAVLLFNHCHHLTIHGVSVDGQYYGYAVIAVNVYGKVVISDVAVTNSMVCTDSMGNSSIIMCSGSGMLFMFIETVNNNSIDTSYNFTFLNSVTISNSINHSPFANVDPIALLQYGSGRVAVFGAGGLTVIFSEGGYHNGQFTIQSGGMWNNQGISGGCLVVYLNTVGVTLPSLSFRKYIVFNKNKPLNGNGGGLGVYVISSSQTHINKCQVGTLEISFNEVLFSQDTASYGGGVYMLLPCSEHIHVNVTFNTVHWYYSEARVAGALAYIESDCLSTYSNATIEFIDLMAFFNGVHGWPYHFWYRELSLLDFNNIAQVIFKSLSMPSIMFHHSSSGPAVAATNTDIILMGSIEFHAIYSKDTIGFNLKALSRLVIPQPATINIDVASSYPYTSLITALGRSYGGYKDCPLVLMAPLSVNISRDVPNDLYVFYSDGLSKCNNSYTKYIKSTTDISKLISSPPAHLCLCGTNMTCVQPNKTDSIISYLGKHITVPVFAVDFEYQSVVAEVFILSCSRNKFTDINKYGKQLLNEDQCTDVRFSLNSVGHCKMSFAIVDEQIHLDLNITLLPCPIGFYNINNNCVCDPYLTQHDIATTCDIDTTSIAITDGTWLGHVVIDDSLLPSTSANNGTFGYAPVCPTGYCTQGRTRVDMTQLYSLCRGHRTAVLCGACDEGYSMVLGSEQCLHCTTDVWLEVTIVVATAGLLLVLLLFCLNVTISSKLLGGVVFYANMTEVSMRTAVLHSSKYGHVLDVVFSLFNLNIGLGVCFYKGMTATDKTALQFVFPVYMWCIVVVLIVVSRFSTRVSNWTSRSSVQVLATLLYLSFAKLLLTVIDILMPVTIKTPEGDFTVWYIDGNVSYWNDTGHIVLLIVAVIVGVVYLMPFVVWTTCGSLLLRFRYVRLRRSAVDAYHGQYRGGWGWWFGARVCLLVMSYVNYAMLRGTNPSLLLVIHMSLMSLFTFVQLLFRPFRLFWLNMLDSAVLGNLIAVEFLSLYTELKQDTTSYVPFISSLMVMIIILLLFIMISHFMNKFKTTRALTNKCIWYLKSNIRHLHALVKSDICVNIEEGIESELREPLLDIVN